MAFTVVTHNAECATLPSLTLKGSTLKTGGAYDMTHLSLVEHTAQVARIARYWGSVNSVTSSAAWHIVPTNCTSR